MKKSIIIVLGIIIVVSLVVVVGIVATPFATFNVFEENDEQILGETVQIPNPFIDCDTIEDAEKLADFTILFLMQCQKAIPGMQFVL